MAPPQRKLFVEADVTCDFHWLVVASLHKPSDPKGCIQNSPAVQKAHWKNQFSLALQKLFGLFMAFC